MEIPANQILHEIEFGHLEDPNTAILNILEALNFKFLGFFSYFQCRFPYLISRKIRMAGKLLNFHAVRSCKLGSSIDGKTFEFSWSWT